MRRTILRAATAALALGVLAACSEAHNTTSVLDSTPPTIQLGVQSTRDSVDLSTPMSVSVKAGDDLSLKRILVAVNGVVAVDTTFHQQTQSFTSTYSIPLTGVTSGTILDVRGIAFDGAGNRSPAADMSVVAYDRSAPVVTVAVSGASTTATYNAGDTVRISVQATDSSGIKVVGYRLLQNDQNGKPVQYLADSTTFSGTSTSESATFVARLPVTLIPGSYYIAGFARNASQNAGVSTNTTALTVRDGIKPGIRFVSPAADSNITIGSQILATVHITDNVALGRLSIVGVTTRGDPNLGAVDTVVHYDSVFAPVNRSGVAQQFRAGLTDSTVRRLLTPKTAGDSTVGPLYLIARVTDAAGNDSVVVQRVQLVSGPNLTVIRPGANAVAAPGKSLIVEIKGATRNGIRTLGYNVSGAFTVTRQAPAPGSGVDTLHYVDTLLVPATVTSGTFTINPFGTDNLGQPGSGPGVTVTVQSLATYTQGPLVYQTVGTRVEVKDSLSIRATDPTGIQKLGFTLMREADRSTIRTDTSFSNGSFTDLTVFMPLNIPVTEVGKKIVITSFAIDTRGNVGYSVPMNVSAPQMTASLARPDTALVVYGRTFPLMQGGTVADIAVDSVRNRVYLSNMTFDRLEVWEQSTQKFNSQTVAVGSQPWGLFVDNSADTLLVANSGGTNLSRVWLGTSGSLSGVQEVASGRIKTPNSYIADILPSIDQAGTARFQITIYDYSDRPQFVAQSNNGDIYYSTVPTPTAPDGTLRRYVQSAKVLAPTDPTVQPDVEQIWQYGGTSGTGHVAVVNADSVYVISGVNSSVGDRLIICDHTANKDPNLSTYCSVGIDPVKMVDTLRTLHGADVVAVSNLDVKSLGLQDTTFVAAGGDRQWIAFGEGHTQGAGRIMMVQNPGNFFSPALNVVDLMHNASQPVNGLALNRNSSQAAAHGGQSYFFETSPTLHLRLQGMYSTFSQGAGIAYHPDNIGDASPSGARVAFVASANGTIEIVDTYHYTSRGTLPVRAQLYGPIRVARPWPGDDPAVILKLFGMTTQGMVVVDIRASDILPLP